MTSQEICTTRAKEEKTGTRTPLSDIYYWHNGECILLFPNSEKEYILYQASDENTLLRSVSRGFSNVRSGDLLQYTTSLYVPSKQQLKIKGERLKWAVIPKDASLSGRSEVLYRGGFYTNENGQAGGGGGEYNTIYREQRSVGGKC